MKINISVEATPQEARQFLGLPDVQPLQDEMMQLIRDKLQLSVAGFDALTLIKTFLPTQIQSVEGFQKAFWDAFAKAGSTAGEAPDQTKEEL
jgi:flagellar motor component MotA